MRHHLVGLGKAHLRSFKSRSVNNGDGIPSKVNPDMMLNEKGLRSEWSNHPELYEGDCYKYANITPQEVEAGYRESIGK